MSSPLEKAREALERFSQLPCNCCNYPSATKCMVCDAKEALAALDAEPKAAVTVPYSDYHLCPNCLSSRMPPGSDGWCKPCIYSGGESRRKRAKAIAGQEEGE